MLAETIYYLFIKISANIPCFGDVNPILALCSSSYTTLKGDEVIVMVFNVNITSKLSIVLQFIETWTDYNV